MPQYKLTYFNGRARAETIRMIFALADVPYEDIRIKREEWPEIKKTLPFGQVPILEIDGKIWFQSNAIGRMLAKEYGLCGKTAEEAAWADVIVDCVEELYPKHRTTSPVYAENSNEEIRLAKLKEYEEVTLPMYLDRLESLLKQNNGGDGWFVGSDITWADLTVYNHMTYVTHPAVKCDLNKVPKLKALFERIEAHPKIAAWINRRPENEF